METWRIIADECVSILNSKSAANKKITGEDIKILSEKLRIDGVCSDAWDALSLTPNQQVDIALIKSFVAAIQVAVPDFSLDRHFNALALRLSARGVRTQITNGAERLTNFAQAVEWLLDKKRVLANVERSIHRLQHRHPPTVAQQEAVDAARLERAQSTKHNVARANRTRSAEERQRFTDAELNVFAKIVQAQRFTTLKVAAHELGINYSTIHKPNTRAYKKLYPIIQQTRLMLGLSGSASCAVKKEYNLVVEAKLRRCTASDKFREWLISNNRMSDIKVAQIIYDFFHGVQVDEALVHPDGHYDRFSTWGRALALIQNDSKGKIDFRTREGIREHFPALAEHLDWSISSELVLAAVTQHL